MKRSSLTHDIVAFNNEPSSYEFAPLEPQFIKFKEVLRNPSNYKWSISKARDFIKGNQIPPEQLLNFANDFIEACGKTSIKSLKVFVAFSRSLKNSREFYGTTVDDRFIVSSKTNRLEFIKTLKKYKKELDPFINITDAQYISQISKKYDTGLSENTIRQYWYSKDHF